MNLRKLFLLTLIIANSGKVIANDHQPRATWNYATLGFVGGFALMETFWKGSAYNQASAILASATGKMVTGAIETQFSKALYVVRKNTQGLIANGTLGIFSTFMIADQIVTLPEEEQNSALLGANSRIEKTKNLLGSYRGNAALKLLGGVALGAGASYGLSLYVKEYLR